MHVIGVNNPPNHITVQCARTGDEVANGDILNFDISQCTIDPIDWIAKQLVQRLYSKTSEVEFNSHQWDLDSINGRYYTYTAEDLNRIDPTIPVDGSIQDLKCIIVEVLDELGIRR